MKFKASIVVKFEISDSDLAEALENRCATLEQFIDETQANIDAIITCELLTETEILNPECIVKLEAEVVE